MTSEKDRMDIRTCCSFVALGPRLFPTEETPGRVQSLRQTPAAHPRRISLVEPAELWAAGAEAGSAAKAIAMGPELRGPGSALPFPGHRGHQLPVLGQRIQLQVFHGQGLQGDLQRVLVLLERRRRRKI